MALACPWLEPPERRRERARTWRGGLCATSRVTSVRIRLVSRFGFSRTRTGGNRENRAGFLSPFSLFPPVKFQNETPPNAAAISARHFSRDFCECKKKPGFKSRVSGKPQIRQSSYRFSTLADESQIG